MSDEVTGLDLEKLLPWFREQVAPVDELRATVVGHGRSNITYRIESGGQSWVLRRPPLSHRQPTAHDMAREFRVISALADTPVPVPRTYAYCDDPAVLDVHFYVMQFVEGLVPTDPAQMTKRYDEAGRRRLGEELVDTLAALHAVDPAAAGLADFGKPQGYVERQVRRFTEQLPKVTKRDLPELDDVARRLKNAIPADCDSTIVHGDYRLDNTILSDDGHIAAVLDWEMSTLGDPLADLGLLRMYWADRDAGGGPSGPGIATSAITALPGFPTWDEVAARYEEKSGRSLAQLDFYTVMANFKLAVILENIYGRFLAGGTVGAGFEMMGQQVLLLGKRALAIADSSSIEALRG